MLSKDLKVVNLNIAEDYYEYKALFRLCSDDVCMDVDLSALSDKAVLADIKSKFGLEESEEDIKEAIMKKVFDASQIESRQNEGKGCCKEVNEKKLQKDIDSLSTS
ncbi:MAG: hypothetical protein GX660_23155 [Clostridiaceae bacterium]|nr:hypothetical protein [Clostridiaceae bacterium]